MPPIRGRRGPTRPRSQQMTPEQAFASAIEWHRAGNLDHAEPIYAVLLQRWPDHVDVLNHYGVLKQQRGDSAAALEMLTRATTLAPEVPGPWNNLGNVLLRLQRLDAAEQAFRRCLALQPDSAEALTNLARALRRRHHYAEAEAACRRAIELVPTFVDAWHALALVLVAAGRVPEGVVANAKATTLLPPRRRERSSFARALVLAGEIDRAAQVYREWLAEEPHNPVVQHHLAACERQGAPERAADAYVVAVFDDFADVFDAKLAALGYVAPQHVADALKAVLPAPQRQFDIADLGCGTGLCGPLVQPWARRLEGIDLSAGMLERAGRRGGYDALHKAELVQFLHTRPLAFDVLISADTLCYFGDLAPLAQAAAASLRDGGTLVFTVEALPDDDPAPHRLQPHGRYAHGPTYLRGVLSQHRLRVDGLQAVVLRNEAALAVRGWLVTAGLASR
jgi:predicted TPR repeat methyltransferase